MIQSKNNVGKWKESLRRRGEMAFANRDKDDEDFVEFLVKSQNRRFGVKENEKTR